MRASLSLALTALFSSVVYGFSSSPTVTHDVSSPGSASLRPRTSILSRPPLALVPNQKNPSASSIASARGGAAALQATTAGDGVTMPKGAASLLASFWGTGGFLYILAKAIKRVIPIAMEPFQEGAIPLSQVQLGCVRV